MTPTELLARIAVRNARLHGWTVYESEDRCEAFCVCNDAWLDADDLPALVALCEAHDRACHLPAS